MNFGGGMGNLLKQAQQMQARMAQLKEELAKKEVEASSGGGAVTVKASGDFQIRAIQISEELAKSGDQAMLEDLVMTAANLALQKAQEMSAAEMGKLTGGMKLPF
jgi:nucleoid-associated protein EbfC